MCSQTGAGTRDPSLTVLYRLSYPDTLSTLMWLSLNHYIILLYCNLDANSFNLIIQEYLLSTINVTLLFQIFTTYNIYYLQHSDASQFRITDELPSHFRVNGLFLHFLCRVCTFCPHGPLHSLQDCQASHSPLNQSYYVWDFCFFKKLKKHFLRIFTLKLSPTMVTARAWINA